MITVNDNNTVAAREGFTLISGREILVQLKNISDVMFADTCCRVFSFSTICSLFNKMHSVNTGTSQ